MIKSPTISNTVQPSYRILEALALFLGFILAIIKAYVAPFSFDEALSYNAFATQSLHTIFTVYDANNHVVNTLGMKAMMGVFGNSEFVLRLPTLIGRLVFLTGAALLVRETLRWPTIRLGCLLLLVLQPFLLDFGSVARGYGIGMGFAMIGLWIAIRIKVDQIPLILNRLPGSPSIWAELFFSIVWGLAIVSVLIFSHLYIPIFFLVLGCLYLRNRKNRFGHDFFLVIKTGLRLGVPATVLFFALYGGFLSSVNRGHFYVGEPGLWDSFRSITRTFTYWHCVENFPNPSGLIGLLWRLMLHPVASLTMLLLVISGVLSWRTDAIKVHSVALFGAILIVVLEHLLFELPYPTERTGIYFIPLGILLSFATIDHLYGRLKGKGTLFLTIPIAMLIFLQLSVWNLTQYLSYWNTAGAKPAMQYIKSQIEEQVDVSTLPNESIAIYPSWCLTPTYNYYRKRLNMPYVKKMEWPDIVQLAEGGAYYITVSAYSQLPKETDISDPILEIPEFKIKVYKWEIEPKDSVDLVDEVDLVDQ
jgi:hypothetical protein